LLKAHCVVQSAEALRLEVGLPLYGSESHIVCVCACVHLSTETCLPEWAFS